MGYGAPSLSITRERNLAGGIEPAGGLTITGPTQISGTSTTVTWSQEGEVASIFRVTLGLTKTDSQIADSGEFEGDPVRNHQWTFTDLQLISTQAWLTVRYRYGNGPTRGIQRLLPITTGLVIVNENPLLNWSDDTLWDDSIAWSE